MRFVGIVDSRGQKLSQGSAHHNAHSAGLWLSNFLDPKVERATVVRTSSGVLINTVSGEEQHVYFLGPDNRFTVHRAGEDRPAGKRTLSANLMQFADTVRSSLMTGHNYVFTRNL